MGRHLGNVARDFEGFMRAEGWSSHVEPYLLPLMFKNSEGQEQAFDFPILLPHEMLHAFYALNPVKFYQVWVGERGLAGILEFWEHAFETMPYLRNHPFAAAIRGNPSLSLPYRLWGDEAPLTKHHSLGLFSISPVLSAMPSMLSRLLLFLYISGQLANLDEVWDVISWSLTCCGEGIMPSRDHQKRRLRPNAGKRFRYAGQEIAGGMRFYLTQVVGDIKHICDSFGFGSAYHRDRLCFLCGATRHQGPFSAFNYRPDAGWQFTMFYHEIYMRDRGQHLRITSIPGFNIGCIQLDMMHILALGLFQVVLGSIFWELCTDRFFCPDVEGPWRQRFAAQLEVAFHDFKQFCRANAIVDSQRPFTIGRLSLSSLHDRPCFKSKAGNTLKVAKWMSNLCTSIATATPSEHNQARAACLWGYVHFVDVCRQAPLWLRESDILELEECRQAALYGHAILASEANSGITPSNLWATKPKCHYFDHLARKAQMEKLNPCNHWVFCDEDFIGRIVRIVHHCGGSNRRLVAAMTRYLVRMHCSLSEWHGPVPDIDARA